MQAVRWISRNNPQAARGLRDAVASAARLIGDYPAVGVVRSELADLPYRFLFLTGYSYVLVYDAERRPPLILRLLHGARDLPELLDDL